MRKLIRNVRDKITNSSSCVHLKTKGNVKGDVLLSSGTEVYKRLNSKQGFPSKHSSAWENYQMSKTFLDLGFNVDIVDFNKRYIPKKDYLICIDFLSNLELFAEHLSNECIKIFHPHFMHWVSNNRSVYNRISNLQYRKGVTVKPKRLLKPNFSLEHADYVTQIGNRVGAATYKYACKKTFHVRHSSNFQYDYPEKKDFNKCRKNYLWIGGYGLEHKGLDLVLEAFAKMPDYHLTVCGRISREKDFEKIYKKELYEMPNIDTRGFIDVKSDEFIELTNNCIGLIYPSCAELSCGGVINCMHSALIPIISKEADIECDDFGVILEDCMIDTIKNAVIKVSCLPPSRLEEMSRQAWEFARRVHTRENYAKDFHNAITQILSHGKN